MKRSLMFASAWLTLGLSAFVAASPVTPDRTAKPSRAAEQGCKWERFSNAGMRLDAWVQRCDFGNRKIDFVAQGSSLAQRYSDGGGKPEPVVDSLDLKPGETPEQGIRRLFDERTDRKTAAQCVLAPWKDPSKKKAPAGVKRYSFEANAKLARAIKARTQPGDMPDSACGDWGEDTDGIQYWEAQPASGVPKVLFVRVGQDTPLFDEDGLKQR